MSDTLDLIDTEWLQSNPSTAEVNFAVAWAAQYPNIDLHTEVILEGPRKFRYDFVHWPSKTAIEIQGHKDHVSIKGVRRDQEKLLYALLRGFVVVQVPAKDADSPEWIEGVYNVINQRMEAAA